MTWLADLMGVPHGDTTDLMKGRAVEAPKAWNFNPTDTMHALSGMSDVFNGAHPGTLGLDYMTLMSVSRIPWIGAIIQTRIQQVAEYCIRANSPYAPGMRVRLKDLKKKMTKAAERQAHEIEHVIFRGGGKYGWSLEPAMRALVRDSLTYDQYNFEVIEQRGGKPWGFVPVDASTMRRARPTEEAKRSGRWEPGDIAYVQVVDSKVVNEYGQREMAWGVRRPRTWLPVAGYGFPELEEVIKFITDLLNATTYNSVNFTNGIHASTILMIKSSMTQDIFSAVQRNIVSMLSGVRNRGRLPIVQLAPGEEDMKAIPLSTNNKDMEFGQWVSWLLKVICAVFQMDPAELGFVYGNEGQTGGIGGESSAQDRISASKERGLRPLLRNFQSTINTMLVEPWDSDFMLEWAGIDPVSEDQRQKLDIEALKSYKTINEVRAEHDLKELDSPIADMVLDNTFITYAMQLMQQDQQQQQGQGQPGQDDGQGGGQQDQQMQGMGGQPIQGDGGGDYNDMDQVTQQMAGAAEKAIRSGQVTLAGGRLVKGRKAMVQRGVRTFIVEAS